jgi:hypothetical protein
MGFTGDKKIFFPNDILESKPLKTKELFNPLTPNDL